MKRKIYPSLFVFIVSLMIAGCSIVAYQDTNQNVTPNTVSSMVPSTEKITVSYYGENEEDKITEYLITSSPDGQKSLLTANQVPILTGFQDFDIMRDLVLAKKDNLWGLYNLTGEKIGDPIYEDIMNPIRPDGYKVNGLVRVKQNGRWGAIDQQGRMVIPPEFDFIHLTFYEEVEPFVKVEKNKKFGYVTREGKGLVEPIWDNAFMDVLNVPEDIIFVQQGDRWGGIRVKEARALPLDWNLKPSEYALLSFNRWPYPYQDNFYEQQIKKGSTKVAMENKLFFYYYFKKNNGELRDLPAFDRGKRPNWDELTLYVYQMAKDKAGIINPQDGTITKEQFDSITEMYFGHRDNSHRSSRFLTCVDGTYKPIGWSDQGYFIFELTDLEKKPTADQQEIWQAKLKGYYMNVSDGESMETEGSPNAQAVWELIKKDENYRPLTFEQALDRLVWNNPGNVLKPTAEWTIEFQVHDPLGEIYFTYLSCKQTLLIPE
ncbi:WG repeat-containing protein [Heliophilum fasciatum]|uniref:WG repeat protein n=1 Tax=Heliophilum fasciatum TaxID=35700 RepID=A0A4R2S0B1_9FIRM|nr:WG repeat-containing protein [Heliophilum fasciatum]MCW2276933.1 hypothetical protein [Heliophilum fasciatum]TCP68607.1 WG repeat protein [Heliophilum fasciatum]